MLIAHLPAGYLASRFTLRLLGLEQDPGLYRRLIGLGLFLAIAPDLDMSWYYLVDHQRAFHHDYITHTPWFWTGLALLITLAGAISRRRGLLYAGLLVLINGLLHLLLDSVVSTIHWSWPSHHGDLHMFRLPRRFGWWVWNYVFYWTFLLELAIVMSAAWVFARGRAMARSKAQLS